MIPLPTPLLWLEVLLVLGIGATVVTVLGMVACRILRTPRWQCVIMQVAVLSVLAITVLEITGVARGVVVRQTAGSPPPGNEFSSLGGATTAKSPEVSRSEGAQISGQATGTSNRSDAESTVLEGKPAVEPDSDEQAGHTAEIPRSLWWPGVIWGAGTVLILLQLLIKKIAVTALSFSYSAVPGDEVCARVQSVARRLSFQRKLKVWESKHIQTPLSFGMLRPVILLPKGFAQAFDARQQETIIAHEIAHLIKKDELWQLCSTVAAALLWWHPAVWWLSQQLRSASETVADEASMIVKEGPYALAESLIKVASSIKKTSLAADWTYLNANSFRSNLGKRIERLLGLKSYVWKRPAVKRVFFVTISVTLVFVAATFAATSWAWSVNPVSPGNGRSFWHYSLAGITFRHLNMSPATETVVPEEEDKQEKKSMPVALENVPKPVRETINNLKAEGTLLALSRRGGDSDGEYLLTIKKNDLKTTFVIDAKGNFVSFEVPPGEQARGTKTVASTIVASKNLQDEIDAAIPGSVLVIPAGVYENPVVITKPLTLQGKERDRCVFEVTADKPAIFVNAKGGGKVVIENLTIKWQLQTSDPQRHPFAVGVQDCTAKINNCAFLPLGNYQRSPIAAFSTGFSEMVITNCDFTQFEYVVCYGEGTSGLIEDSFITESGHQGITLYRGARATVRRNIVTGSLYHGVRSTGGELTMKENLIIKNKNRGVYLGNKPCKGVISGNLFIGNGVGIDGVSACTFLVENNVFLNSGFGAITGRSYAALTVRRNVIADNLHGIVFAAQQGGSDAVKSTVGENVLWNNTIQTENCEAGRIVQEDPKFAAPEKGDFSLGEDKFKEMGLTAPDVLRRLWLKYQEKQMGKEDNKGEGR